MKKAKFLAIRKVWAEELEARRASEIWDYLEPKARVKLMRRAARRVVQRLQTLNVTVAQALSVIAAEAVD